MSKPGLRGVDCNLLLLFAMSKARRFNHRLRRSGTNKERKSRRKLHPANTRTCQDGESGIYKTVEREVNGKADEGNAPRYQECRSSLRTKRFSEMKARRRYEQWAPNHNGIIPKRSSSATERTDSAKSTRKYKDIKTGSEGKAHSGVVFIATCQTGLYPHAGCRT